MSTAATSVHAGPKLPRRKANKTHSSRAARPLSPAQHLQQYLFPPKKRRTHAQKLGGRWLPMNRQATKPKPSKLTAVWQRLTRQKPQPPQQALDTTLAWGDVLMLTTTQIASERVPLWQAGALSTVLVVSWVLVALAKGDYLNWSEPRLLGLDVGHLVDALWRSVATWVLYVPVAIALCSSLVAHSYIDAHPFTPVPPTSPYFHDLPAELEVLLASLFTVTCWRGAWALLRPYV